MPLLRVLAGAAISICLSAEAIATECVLSEPERATVAKVKDGETLELTDGRLVRLIGAKSPLPPLGWRGDDPWPQVEESRQSLVALAEGAEVELNSEASVRTAMAICSRRFSLCGRRTASGCRSASSRAVWPGPILSPTTRPAW